MYSQKRFVQTLRLAFLVLATRISTIPEFIAIRREVEESLLSRCIGSGGWGDWWLNEDNYDPTPSIFTSCVSLLALALFRTEPFPPAHRSSIAKVVEMLKRSMQAKGRLSNLEIAAVTAGLSTWQSYSSRSGVKHDVALRWRSLPEQRHGIYFFFYEYAPGADGRSFGRDYLLVPLELLVAIGGLQSAAKASLRLTAEEIVSRLLKTLDDQGGLYRVAKRDHISSIDQAWAAIAIAYAISAWEGGSRLPGVLSRSWHGLVKEREDNAFTGTVFPVITVIFFAVVNALPWIESSPLIKIAISVGTVFAAALYGDNILRRMLRGKE
jgi:hypothetical protein